MNTPERYTVIGAGHGGKAMAAHLALMGLKVTLYNRTFDHISIIKKRGGIDLESTEGGPHGFGKLVNGHLRYGRGAQESTGDHGGGAFFRPCRYCQSRCASI